MNIIFAWLSTYSVQLRNFALTLTCIQLLAGIRVVFNVKNRKTSDMYQPETFLGALALTILSWRLAVLEGNTVMENINYAGTAFNLIFIAIFYWYASPNRKPSIHRKTLLATLTVAVLMAYSVLADPDTVKLRMGFMTTILLVLYVGRPLLNIGQVLQNRSTANLSLTAILTSFMVTTSWTLYALSIWNKTMLYENLLMLALDLVELSLFLVYPRIPRCLRRNGNVEVFAVRSVSTNLSMAIYLGR